MKFTDDGQLEVTYEKAVFIGYEFLLTEEHERPFGLVISQNRKRITLRHNYGQLRAIIKFFKFRVNDPNMDEWDMATVKAMAHAAKVLGEIVDPIFE